MSVVPPCPTLCFALQDSPKTCRPAALVEALCYTSGMRHRNLCTSQPQQPDLDSERTTLRKAGLETVREQSVPVTFPVNVFDSLVVPGLNFRMRSRVGRRLFPGRKRCPA